MKLIVGLGNPGGKYLYTRHNVGFTMLDRLQRAIAYSQEWIRDEKSRSEICHIKERDVILLKPQTFMNDSGVAVSKFVNFYKIKIDDVCVIHDDLDIALGDYKFQKGKGPKDHKGIISIEQALGSKEFWRMRIGVENRTDSEVEGQDYVLMNFSTKEEETLSLIIAQSLADLTNFING